MSNSQSAIQQFFTQKHYKKPESIVNALVFLSIIAIPNSPEHGAGVLFIFVLYSLYWLFKNKPPLLTGETKTLLVFISLLLFFFITGAFWQPEGLENTRYGANIDYHLRWILLLPLLFVFSHVRVSWKVLSWAISVSSIIGMCIALCQVQFLKLPRAGAFNHPIPFGEMMVALDLMSWILMSHAIIKKERLLSIVMLLGSLAGFYAALLSGSRGSWVAYVLMILVWFIFLYKSKKTDSKIIFNGQIWLRIIGMVVIAYLVAQADQFKSASQRTMLEFERLSQNDMRSSAGTRLLMWETSWKLQKKYPCGVGTGNFKNAVNSQIAQALKEEKKKLKAISKYDHAHNQYINILVENGWQTVMIFVLFQVYQLVYFYKGLSLKNDQSKVYAAMGLLLVLGFIVFQMTQTAFNHHAVVLFYITFLYLFYGQSRHYG